MSGKQTKSPAIKAPKAKSSSSATSKPLSKAPSISDLEEQRKANKQPHPNSKAAYTASLARKVGQMSLKMDEEDVVDSESNPRHGEFPFVKEIATGKPKSKRQKVSPAEEGEESENDLETSEEELLQQEADAAELEEEAYNREMKRLESPEKEDEDEEEEEVNSDSETVVEHPERAHSELNKDLLSEMKTTNELLRESQKAASSSAPPLQTSANTSTVLTQAVRPLGMVNVAEIARLEMEYHSQQAVRTTLTVGQAISEKLRVPITSMLQAKGYLTRKENYINSWINWEVPVLMHALKKIVGVANGDQVDAVQTVALLIKDTHVKITSVGKTEFGTFVVEVWTKVTENLDDSLLEDKLKEPLFAVRGSVLFVFGLTPFGKQVVKSLNAIHFTNWAFGEWFQTVIDTYFTLADIAAEGRRLIYEEVREEIKAEYAKRGYNIPAFGNNPDKKGNPPNNNNTNQKSGGKDSKHSKRKREEHDTSTDTKVDTKADNNCYGCGKRHRHPCVWTEHPDYNHDKTKKWKDSAIGKKWIEQIPALESLPIANTLDKSLLPAWIKKKDAIFEKMKKDAKSGKKPSSKQKKQASRTYVNSILREDTTHDIDIPFDCDANGIRTCTLINPLDQSTMLTLRVMLDTGALGKGANYISKEVAGRLKDFGYEPTVVDRVVCGCFIGSSKRITENFKLRLSFKESDGSFKTVVVKCDVINTKHDVIIGYDTIKHCSYIRELMMRNINQEKSQFNMTETYCQEELIEGLEGAVTEGDHDPEDSVDSRKPNVNLINTMLNRSEDRDRTKDEISDSDESSDEMDVSDEQSDVTDENINYIKFGGNPEFQKQARSLCEELKCRFNTEIGKEPAKITPMEIELTADWETKENCLNPRLQSQLKDKEISAQVQKMLGKQILSDRSRATAHSQVMLTVKTDGSWRFCIDYRRLNVITKPNAWPLPRIKQTLQRIGEKKPSHFAVVDLTKGFFQLEMAKNCQHLTAFITRDGKYEWQRVPMGLTGAPSYFQRAMQVEVLVGLVHHICEVYLDDIIIYGKTEEEFLINLRLVLERLKEFNITCNPKKCKIGLEEIEYVGHVINKDGITFSREKLQKVIDVPVPETCKQLRSFVGLANYFRDHVENHSARIEPLTRLLDNYEPRRRIEWDKHPGAYTAFEDIKLAINQCPQLFFMDDVSPIHLYTDASIKGVGAYLCQRRADGIEYPIAFFSKSLNSTEQNWGVPELEGYAIYAAFKHFDYLLRDVHTHVHTDHKNLVYIRDTGSDKVLRWKMMLQEYSFTTEFVAGVDNPIADYWSRNEAAEVDTYVPNEPHKKGNMLCTITQEGDDLQHLCTSEGVAGILRNFAENLFDAELNNIEEEECNECNAQTQFEIPHEKYEEIRAVHNPRVGHHGVETTMDKLKKKGVSWKYMRQHVKKFCHECDTCQKNSYSKLDVRVQKYTTGSYYPMERLMIDTVSIPTDKWGYKAVVVIIDCFSRYMTCYPVKTFEAEEAADALLQHTGHYGVPAQLFSDGGSQYVNAIIKSFLELTGTEHVVGMAYSHQEQSIVERSIAELSRWLRSLLHDTQVKHEYWSRYLPFAQRIHNATTIKTIGHAPAEILFGDRLSLERNILIPQELREHKNTEVNTWMANRDRFQDTMINAAQKLAKQHEEDHLREEEVTPKLTDFPIDSYVLVAYPETGYGPKRPSKLFMMHKGPFQVISRKENTFKLLNLVNGKSIDKSIYLLRPYFWNEQETTPEDAAKKDWTDEYDVEEILEHKGQWARKTSLTFLVKWFGYEATENTWEPWANVSSSEHLDTYLIKHNREKLSPRYVKPVKEKKVTNDK